MRVNLSFLVLLVYVGVLLKLLQASEVFISIKYQKVIEHQPASAYCNTSTLINESVTWFKENKPHVIVSRTPNLTFTSILRGDAGRYVCNASDVGPFFNNTVYFNDSTFFDVLYPPELISISEIENVVEGFRLFLNCDARGNPKPKIVWYKERRRISIEGLFLFRQISRNDSGTYKCVASNGIGNDKERTIKLDVEYPPKIVQMPKIRESWLYDELKLVCNASGNPKPVYKWYRPNVNASDSNSEINFTVSSEKQFGGYRCVVDNGRGNDSYSVELVRTRFPPDAPVITNNVTTVTSRNFTITWTKPSDNNSTITQYLVWQKKIFHNGSLGEWERFNHNITLPLNLTFFLEWEMCYQFAVSAENRQGISPKGPHKNITVIAEPTEIIRKPTDSAVIYACVGVGALLLLIVIIVMCCKCRNKKQPPPPCPKPDLEEERYRNVSMKELTSRLYRRGTRSNSHYSSRHPPFDDSQPLEDIPNDNDAKVSYVNAEYAQEHAQAAIYDNLTCVEKSVRDWEIPRKNVKIEKIIGKGAFCQVAKAFVEGLGTVAVKMIKETSGKESNRKDLLAEYKLLQHLGTHDNVVLVLGGVTNTDPIMVIFEYVPYGDLLGYLRRSRGLNDTYYNDPDEKPLSSLTSQQLMRFSREIADGMAFLSKKKIVHRDLAARNVLVCQGEMCKITDFGMARDVTNDDIYRKRTRGRLPVKWTAYEALLYGLYSTQSDVWSYAIVLYEIFTIGGCPYPGQDGRQLAQIIQTGYRMPKPKHVDDEIYALMSECWRTEPERRPTFDTIAMTLRRLERHHKDYIFMNQYEENLYANVDDL